MMTLDSSSSKEWINKSNWHNLNRFEKQCTTINFGFPFKKINTQQVTGKIYLCDVSKHALNDLNKWQKKKVWLENVHKNTWWSKARLSLPPICFSQWVEAVVLTHSFNYNFKQWKVEILQSSWDKNQLR